MIFPDRSKFVRENFLKKRNHRIDIEWGYDMIKKAKSDQKKSYEKDKGKLGEEEL